MAGILIRACCCGPRNYYPLLYCPDGTEETGQALALTDAMAAAYVGKVVQVADPEGGGGIICAIVGDLPDPPLDPDDYAFPTFGDPLDDCTTCCPADHYQQAYDCTTLLPTGLWRLASDVMPGKILKVGGGDTGAPLACYFFADCAAEIPEGDTTIDPDIIRGWFDHCAACTCATYDPSGLAIAVSQDDIDCCQWFNDAGIDSRTLTQGSASGSWVIPISYGGGPYPYGATGYGSLTVSGPHHKVMVDAPTPFSTFDPACLTFLQSVAPSPCCDDDGTLLHDTNTMTIEVFVGTAGAGPGGVDSWVQASFPSPYSGCILWYFALPSCTDANDESELVGSGTCSASGFPDCSTDNPVCPGVPEATATMVLQWAA